MHRDRSRWCLSGVVLLFILLVSGCATQTRSLLQDSASTLPRQVELSAVPFHPQERFQCGPATLAMSLNAFGIAANPNTLVTQVYVPQREGSLQPEMLAAARRNGAIGMTIAPALNGLLMELAAGNPVIVLQNLSLPWFPLWHYALAIGYDLDHAELILRSGTTERLVLPLSTFEHTWARSGYWGMVTLPPGRLPASADEAMMVQSLVAFEKAADPTKARKAYEAALRRWPRNATLQLGFGNTAYAAGDRIAAANAFRNAVHAHPDNAAAYNNLATVLAELGEYDQASRAAEKAIALGGPWRDTAQITLQSIRSARQKKER